MRRQLCSSSRYFKLILASPETFGTPGVLWLAVNCCAGFAWILDFMARDEIRST